MLKYNPSFNATLAVALSGILYGGLGFFGTKLVAQGFSINCMLFWRFFLASLWVLVPIICMNSSKLSNFRNMNYRELILITISYCGSSWFYFIAAKSIGTGIGMVIFFIYPVFVTIFSMVFLNWLVTYISALSLTGVVFGLFLLKGNAGVSISAGFGYAVLAALFYAVYVYRNRINRLKIDTDLQTFILCLGNSLIFLALSIHEQNFTFPSGLYPWWYAIALAILATAIPIQLLLIGLKYINPIKASILSVLEPVMTLIVGYLFLHEHISQTQCFGIIVILIATLVIQFDKREYVIREH